jgi:hypothetical protein
MKCTGSLSLCTVALSMALAVTAEAATRYVNINSPAPLPPYTSWETAANNIQDAVDVAAAGDLVRRD